MRGRRNITDQIIRARDNYVNHGITSDTENGEQVGLDARTIKRYRVRDGWEKQREQTITTPVAIGTRLQKIIVKLMDEMDAKLAAGEIVSDFTLARVERITAMLVKLDKNYDDKGTMILAMKRFIGYCNRRNEKDAIKILDKILPDFYRSLSEEG